MQVAALKTPISDDELLAALRAAWLDQLGGAPSHESLAVLASQVALETAHGASCICWNLGNNKAYAGVDYCTFRTIEYIGDKAVAMQQNFAAYPDLATGVRVYLHGMWSRWTAAWPSVVAGDPLGFALGLHQGGYYTAPVDKYAAGVERWFSFYMAKLSGDPAPTEPEIPETPIAEPDLTA